MWGQCYKLPRNPLQGYCTGRSGTWLPWQQRDYIPHHNLVSCVPDPNLKKIGFGIMGYTSFVLSSKTWRSILLTVLLIIMEWVGFHYVYSGTPPIRTVFRPFRKDPKHMLFNTKSPLKCGHPSNKDTFTGPKGGRFREVPLYSYTPKMKFLWDEISIQ